jgi:digeranylgeranylglycerophospholipid reductase
MLPAMRDVVIVGGGPAGLYAGLRLAAEGFDVGVLEEHEAVGEPVHCTGVLAEETFDEFGISRASVLNRLTTARFWSPSGQDVVYSGGGVEAVVVDRRLFDQGLFADAQRAGVSIAHGGRVTAIDVSADRVSVRVADGREVRARVCVLACGAGYSLQRRLGLGMPGLFLQTAQLELAAERLGDVELHFGLNIAPKGFGWAVPVRRPDGPHVRIGVMCERNAPQHFLRVADRVADRWGIDRDSARRPRQKVLPLAPIPRTFTDRLVVVGAAAGLVKPTTGGGIYYGLVSAALAASVLSEALHGGDASAGKLEMYERRWREQLASEVQAQHTLRMLAHDMSDHDIERLFELARTDGVMPIVRQTASFNRHRKLILALLRYPPVRQIMLSRLVC